MSGDDDSEGVILRILLEEEGRRSWEGKMSRQDCGCGKTWSNVLPAAGLHLCPADSDEVTHY